MTAHALTHDRTCLWVCTDTHPQAVAGVSYQLAPRAMIFRRDNGKAVDIESFKVRWARDAAGCACVRVPRVLINTSAPPFNLTSQQVLRSNDYRADPYSHDNPFAAICSRGDLAGSAGGCYDTKVRSMHARNTHTHTRVLFPAQRGKSVLVRGLGDDRGWHPRMCMLTPWCNGDAMVALARPRRTTTCLRRRRR